MQMKKITLLLMVFALAWSGQLKAVTLPETSKDGKVKWYFIQSMRQDYGEPMFYTVDGDLIRGRVKADYSDYATLAKQLWCFETEDGEWYTITNRYDGRKLGVGMGPNGESLMMYDEAQAKFKLRDSPPTPARTAWASNPTSPLRAAATSSTTPLSPGPTTTSTR